MKIKNLYFFVYGIIIMDFTSQEYKIMFLKKLERPTIKKKILFFAF